MHRPTVNYRPIGVHNIGHQLTRFRVHLFISANGVVLCKKNDKWGFDKLGFVARVTVISCRRAGHAVSGWPEGRVGSGQMTKFAKKIAQFLSSVIYTVVCSLNKSVKCFSETTQSSAVAETSHLLYSRIHLDLAYNHGGGRDTLRRKIPV